MIACLERIWYVITQLPPQNDCSCVWLERDAFGCDDYHPVSKKGANLTTNRGVGYMITDALDTMLIMGKELSEKYQRARNWVATDLDFDRDGRYSTFEASYSTFIISISMTMSH